MNMKLHFIWQLFKGYAKLKIHLKPFGLFAHNPFGYYRLL